MLWTNHLWYLPCIVKAVQVFEGAVGLCHLPKLAQVEIWA